MEIHWELSIAACAGHLALAILVWLRRGQSPLARVLALLFLDMFAWNFADLAYHLTGAVEWRSVDRTFSSLMPALGFDVVILFVGKRRPMRKLVWASYAAFGLIAVLSGCRFWSTILLACAAGAMLFAGYLLWVHRRQTSDLGERARAQLILLAIAVVTLVGSTDLWFDQVSLPVPRLSNVGTLAGLALFAIAVMRRRLLGAETPPAFLAYSAALGTLCMVAYLAAVRWLDPRAGLAVIAVLSGASLVFVVAHELWRVSARARDRAERHVLLGRFSEQLAHDLRNPLAALKGAVEFLIAERAAGRSLDHQARFIGLMLDQVERVQGAIDRYLHMTRVDPVTTLASLNGVVHRVMALQSFAAKQAIELRTELDGLLPDCQLDGDLMAAALENLVRNACEAMPGGGILTVRTERGSETAGADCVALSVEDSGRGMDPRELEHAADAFFTTKPGGGGLGLSFAERVAQAHGGTLRLTSTLGKGTLVRLSIPVAG
jgi:two-component system sensor histidine kinase HydH